MSSDIHDERKQIGCLRISHRLPDTCAKYDENKPHVELDQPHQSDLDAAHRIKDT